LPEYLKNHDFLRSDSFIVQMAAGNVVGREALKEFEG
jgi:hypothetical protein